MINVSDLKPGVTFQMDGNLFVVLDYSHNKTARAAANIKVKMKNLRTGSIEKKCNTCIIQGMHLYLWMEKHMNKLKFQLKI